MNFLIDNSISYIVSDGLGKMGHSSVHIREYQIEKADDTEIFQRAKKEKRIIITADTDFGTLAARYNSNYPSIIIFRTSNLYRPSDQIDFLKKLLKRVEGDLLKGAIIVIEDSRVRIRALPIN